MLAKHPSPSPVMTGEVFKEGKESLALSVLLLSEDTHLARIFVPVVICIQGSSKDTRNRDAFPTRDSTAGQLSHLFSSHLIMKNFPRE